MSKNPLMVFMELAAKVDKDSLANLANLAQHVLQSDNPTKELNRLLNKLDPELKPMFRISRASDSVKKG